MILADTSAWVEYVRGTGGTVDRRIRQLVEDTANLAVSEPVVMEVLAGARDQYQEDALRRLLGRFHLLQFETVVDFEGAADIYRACRRAGITPRGMVDCMIATVAQRAHAVLLAHDADMFRIAQVVGIELDDASLRAR